MADASLNDSALNIKLSASLLPSIEVLSQSLHRAYTLLHVATAGERFATFERSTIHEYLTIVEDFVREAGVGVKALQQAIKGIDQPAKKVQ